MYDGVRRDGGGATATPLPSRALRECFVQKPAPRLRVVNLEP
jgi:hypothetical protein